MPFRIEAMREELRRYVIWHNEHRPHQALGGRTPAEVHDNVEHTQRFFEPRPRWPIADTSVRRVEGLEVRVCFLDGARHLPIVSLQQVA